MRHVSRTHRVALDWLLDRINLDPKIHIKVRRHQTPTIRHIDTRELHTWWVEQSSSQPFQLHLLLRIPAWPGAKNDGEKDARTERRREDCGKVKADVELGLICLYKFFDCAESDCVKKPGDIRGTLSTWLDMYRETWRKRTQSRRSVEFSRVAKQKETVLDVGARKLVATEEDQEHMNYLEDSVRTRKLVASGNSETEGSDKDGTHNLQNSTNDVLFRLFFC